MAKDPYRYYRIEARELLEGLQTGVSELERGTGDREVVTRLLRLAHTLKGAARVVKQPRTADLAHSLEGSLAPHRDGGPPPSEVVGKLARDVELIAQELAAMDAPLAAAPAAPAAPGRPAPAEERFETVRVELAEMDVLLEGVSEVGVQVSALRRDHSRVEAVRGLAAALAELLETRGTGAPKTLQRARALSEELLGVLDLARRGLSEGIDRSEAELRLVRDRAHTLRLVPAGAVFAELERTARDAAAQLGKRVDFQAEGGEHRLDGHVLAPLRDALLHAVRNAVDHGIEREVERVAAGKAPVGKLRLEVKRLGSRMRFTLSDDGRGLDVEAIRRAAVTLGRIPPTQALDASGAVKLLLQGGLSTAASVTQISGRGIGFDVVRTAVERVKASLDIKTEDRRGTSLEIVVPLSLSSFTVLLVEAGGLVACLPVEAVHRALRVPAAEIVSAGDHDAVRFEGGALPFVSLARSLSWKTEAEAPRVAWLLVVLNTRKGRVAVGVDRLVGTADVVVRPLPAGVGRVALVVGLARDAEGDPQPVCDPDGLGEAARDGRVRLVHAAPRERTAILVVDDSLTTRMLEQGILESAGFLVDLATSGEEALAMARARRYGLLVVDVEMPGMSGFELVARTRADPELERVPAILVTSRGAPEDRRRGAEVGARAYIVKGEFDQNAFLDTVRSLVS
jgi:two-component system chemotaxis sensor kinase CheA